MMLDRLVIAGLAWAGRALLTHRRTGERGGVRERSTPPEAAPVETQEVVGPDRDLLQSMDVEDLGFEGGLR
jgi:hypothetical protein